jgi:hypothetical protein
MDEKPMLLMGGENEYFDYTVKFFKKCIITGSEFEA